MILANGEQFPASAQNRLLHELPERITQTRIHSALSCETVIAALDRIAGQIAAGAFSDEIADPLLRSQVQFAANMLSRDAISRKVRTELGWDWERPRRTGAIVSRTVPLGTILHIAAGNMDALPAWSVIEGLLAGNINLLKLPQADAGLTIRFLSALIQEEPELRDFIYVWDTPSTDVQAMQKLAAVADGISVWGGDAAITAVRQLAPPGCKLIEWGHRLGFCYISGSAPERELHALASHIAGTQQLLCSACQVIYLDTADFEEVLSFSGRFLPVLEEACLKLPQDIGVCAAQTLRRYTKELESVLSGGHTARKSYPGTHCTVTACRDSTLELSDLHGNVLVKPLPRKQLLPTLRISKDYLQTAGLICPAAERPALTELLIRAGINRVLLPGQMSHTFPGESHDGEYALRRYTRIVNVQVEEMP